MAAATLAAVATPLLLPHYDGRRPSWPNTMQDIPIRTALLRLGVKDVLEWAKAHCTLSLVDLTKQLGDGIAPFSLETLMAEEARASHRYDPFVRMQAVRRLNEQLQNLRGDRFDYGRAAGYASWASLIEARKKSAALAVWDRLIQAVQAHPDWSPSSPDDPLVLAAFGDASFGPSDRQLRFDEAMAKMRAIAGRRNHPFSFEVAIKNFSNASPGFGFLFALNSVDTQVSNGGFAQFYDNTGGAPAALAIEGFRAIGRDQVADVIRDSVGATGQSLEDLDRRYYALADAAGDDWLELAMIDLVIAKPELFK